MSDVEDRIYDEVTELLQENVYDPEVGINIIDLGLVYGVDISSNGIFLSITLTSVACPLKDLIEEDILNVLGTSETIKLPIFFNWVFEPLWSPARMTDEGKLQLTSLGGYIPTY